MGMPPTREIIGSIVLYCSCSSSLLFLNKLVISSVGVAPGSLILVQVTFSTFMCGAGAACRLIDLDLELRKVRMFSLYVFAFVGSIYSSVMALNRSNVETIIVFRGATPIAVAVLETLLLGRRLPSWRSTAALLVIGLAAASYVLTDSQFQLEGWAGYSWALTYFALICFEMTFGKHLLTAVKVTIWESVFLSNFLALPCLTFLGYATGDLAGLASLDALTFTDRCFVLVSAAVAFLIGYAGWWCRSLVSATTYTLVGLANKIGTVLLAIIFLDNHASNLGVAALLVCIAASSQYQQAPLRAPESRPKVLLTSPPEDEESLL